MILVIKIIISLDETITIKLKNKLRKTRQYNKMLLIMDKTAIENEMSIFMYDISNVEYILL